tara:strand:- start:430 stop:714 length:285 start_codon:yes stop_codon:yes gene_type:complete
MTDYWLSKLFFDLQSPATNARWKQNRDAVLDEYPLRPEIRAAVLANDIGKIAPHVNAYLLRFYFSITGMKDDELLARLHALKPTAGKIKEAQHG